MLWAKRSDIRGRHRLGAALATAATAVLVATSPVQALSFGPPIPLGSGPLIPGGSLAASGGSYVHVVYMDSETHDQIVQTRILYRRSVNGGTSWLPAVELSRPGTTESWRPVVSVVSATVDVVWTEGFSDPEAAVWYRRSTNSGATWGAAVRISPTSSMDTGAPAVARQGSTVLVSYTDRETAAVHFRRSIDGGATWQNVRTLGTAGSSGVPGLFDGSPSMAFGSGVLYAVWKSESATINLRRSFDGGVTWTATTALATDGSAPMRIAVSGSEAMLTFTRAGASTSYAAFRKTSDKGSHWAPAQRVSGGAREATAADVRYAAGRYRLVYRQCLDDACDTRGLLYRESASGASWTWPVRFTITGHAFAEPMGIGHTSVTGKTWLGWTGFVDFQSDITVFVRSVQ